MKKWLFIPLILWCAVAFGTAVDPDAERVKRLLARGNLREENGQLDEAARDYEAARVAAVRSGNRELTASAYVQLGYLQYYRGETNSALANLRRGYDILHAIGDARGQRTALAYIAHVYADARVGEYDRAIEYYRQILDEHQAAGETEHVADTLFNIASTYERKGDTATALEWYRKALEAEETIGRAEEAAFVKRSIGITLGKLGRGQEALPLFEQAYQTLEAANDRDRAMGVRQSRGIVYRQLGRYAQAIADLEVTRRWFEETGNSRFLEKTEDELALAYAGAARWREAYEARTRHGALQRELAEKLRDEHTSRLRIQFDSRHKEQENRALLREKKDAERIRNLQTVALGLSAAIIIVLAWFAIRRFRDARRTLHDRGE